MQDHAAKAAATAADRAQGWYAKAFGAEPSKEQLDETLSKSKLALSNLYKKAPGLCVGVGVGALAGYRLG